MDLLQKQSSTNHVIIFIPCYALTSVLLRKKRPYSEFSWSVFFRIQTEYGDSRSVYNTNIRLRQKNKRKDNCLFSSGQCLHHD